MNSLLRISWRLMWSRKWVTFASLLALALPTALSVILLVVRHQTEGALKKDAGQFDMVVGAKGGSMQLVLSSLYHLGMPSGNIPYAEYLELKKDTRITTAIPIGLGDNYNGYRIVGTEPHIFDLTDHNGEKTLPFSGGISFAKGTFEAVIGAQVAAQSGLALGDTFHGTHGLLQIPGAEIHTDYTYHVVGILEPTGSAHDRAIYTSIESVWKVHHAEESIHQVFRGKLPINQDVTAVLLQLESAGLRLWMLDELKKKPNLMAAVPINEILALSRVYLAPFQKLLFIVTIGVVIVSCIVILLAMWQALERREQSFLTLRSLGASRGEILRILFYEVSLLVGIGIIAGAALGHLSVQLLTSLIYQRTGLMINAWELAPGELLTLGSILLVLLLAGLLPVITIYRQKAQ